MNSKRIWGIALLLVIGGAAAIVLLQQPGWLLLLLGTVALAALYIVARLNSRFDPMDPRFGSCIPPMTRPRDP